MKKLSILAALISLQLVAEAAAPRNPCRLCNIADVNFDGEVDGLDLQLALSNYGRRVPKWKNGDLNGDRRVTNGDIELLMRQWGCRCS